MYQLQLSRDSRRPDEGEQYDARHSPSPLVLLFTNFIQDDRWIHGDEFIEGQ